MVFEAIWGLRYCSCCRLGCTSEFLIYGHGQQRRAIIEAVRLLENEKSRQNHDACILGEDSNGITSLQLFKDKSKKWLKFVAQVVVLCLLFIMCCILFSFQKLYIWCKKQCLHTWSNSWCSSKSKNCRRIYS